MVFGQTFAGEGFCLVIRSYVLKFGGREKDTTSIYILGLPGHVGAKRPEMLQPRHDPNHFRFFGKADLP
jgi:hypothetical protein